MLLTLCSGASRFSDSLSPWKESILENDKIDARTDETASTMLEFHSRKRHSRDIIVDSDWGSANARMHTVVLSILCILKLSYSSPIY